MVCTAERGLCGAFNSSIARLARDKALALKAEGKTVKIICVGKKGFDMLRRQFEKDIIEVIDLRAFKQVGYRQCRDDRAEHPGALQCRRVRRRDAVLLAFKSVISQIPTAQRIIPAEIPAGTKTTEPPSTTTSPTRARSSRRCCRATSPCRCCAAILENAASEQGARMSAMDSATRNAGEMIKKQTQLYNRSRQAMITKELIEIISGAEAL